MASSTDNTFADKLRRRLKPSSPRRFAAIDFDSTSVRVVHARSSGKTTRIDTLYSAPVPEDLDLENAESVGRFLEDVLKDFSRSTKTSLGRCGIMMSVPRQKAVLKPLTLPPGTPHEDIAAMVRFQVEKELPFSPDKSVIDFTVTSHLDPSESANGGGETPGGVGVLVGAVSRDVVEHYSRIAETAGVKLWRLGLRPYSNMKCVDACVRRGDEETIMSVHITSNETEINVLKGASLAFSRSAIINVPADEPEGRKRAVESVVREVIRSVHSYSSAQHHGEITGVLIAGGTGIEAQVLTVVETKLKVQCEMLAPAGAMDLPTHDSGSAYSATIGLAIAQQGQALPFDFLNPKQPPVKHDARKTRAAMIAAIAVFSLLAIGIAINMYLGGLEAPLEAARARESKLRKATKGHTSLARRVKTVEAWLKARTNWADHLTLLTQLAPSCEELYIRSSIKTERRGTITFKAYAKGHKVLDDFKARLADAGYNPQSKGSGPSDRGDYTHSEEITLTVKPGMKVDLTKHKHVPRPADDDSARILREGGSTNGSRSGSRSGTGSTSGSGGSRRTDRSRSSRYGGSRR